MESVFSVLLVWENILVSAVTPSCAISVGTPADQFVGFCHSPSFAVPSQMLVAADRGSAAPRSKRHGKVMRGALMAWISPHIRSGQIVLAVGRLRSRAPRENRSWPYALAFRFRSLRHREQRYS